MPNSEINHVSTLEMIRLSDKLAGLLDSPDSMIALQAAEGIIQLAGALWMAVDVQPRIDEIKARLDDIEAKLKGAT